MQIGIAQLIGGLVAIALLIGGAFTVGTKWDGGSTETAAAVSVLHSPDAPSTEEIAAPADAPLYKVLRVVDGDTIAVEINGKSQTVRLIGVDTPEINDSRTGVQCFGKEASEETKSLLTGKYVRFEKDSSQGEFDKYKRLLAYVFREDGVFINKTLIAEGYAHEYTYDLPYKYQTTFKSAEVAAREAGTGLWSSDACPIPAPRRSVKSSASSDSNVNQAASAAAAAAPMQPVQAPVSIPQPAQMTPAPVQMQSQQTAQTKVEPPAPPKPEPNPPPATRNEQLETSSIICSTNTYNCSDFKTQQEAQAVYDQCGGLSNDVHKLDKNKDGHPCDGLP